MSHPVRHGFPTPSVASASATASARVGGEADAGGNAGDIPCRHHAIQRTAADGRIGGHFSPRFVPEFRRAVEVAADCALIGLVRVAAELRIRPPEARKARVVPLRPHIVLQAMKVGVAESVPFESDQDVR